MPTIPCSDKSSGQPDKHHDRLLGHSNPDCESAVDRSRSRLGQAACERLIEADSGDSALQLINNALGHEMAAWNLFPGILTGQRVCEIDILEAREHTREALLMPGYPETSSLPNPGPQSPKLELISDGYTLCN